MGFAIPPVSLVRKFFSYDRDTGVLTNATRRNNRTPVGAESGYVGVNGYRHVCLNRRSYPAHRIIWVHVYGSIPDGAEIDHINGDKLDNRISNLRLASHAQNGRNAKVRCDNRSGYKGVSWSKKDRVWCAFIHVDGRAKYLGGFPTPEKASSAYREAALLHHGEFARLA
jgi:hypothetical protein